MVADDPSSYRTENTICAGEIAAECQMLRMRSNGRIMTGRGKQMERGDEPASVSLEMNPGLRGRKAVPNTLSYLSLMVTKQ
jgi:hypothetical protein